MTITERIRSDIEARIHSGDWPPGTRIPFEHELVVQYGCARATVNKALEALARAGLIDRRRKAGSFVAAPQIHSAILEVPDLPRLIEARGQRHRWQPLLNRDARRSEIVDASEILGTALLVEGIHLADAEPLAYERRLIAHVAVPRIEPERFASVAPGTWLLEHTPWTSARHQIRAVEADADLSRALQIRQGAACLEVQRWTWRSSTTVTYVVQTFRGDRFDMTAEFRPG